MDFKSEPAHCQCLSFPEEIERDTEEPESHLSWLPAPLRKPLVTGYLMIHLLWSIQQPLSSNMSLALSVSRAFISVMPSSACTSSICFEMFLDALQLYVEYT